MLLPRLCRLPPLRNPGIEFFQTWTWSRRRLGRSVTAAYRPSPKVVPGTRDSVLKSVALEPFEFSRKGPPIEKKTSSLAGTDSGRFALKNTTFLYDLRPQVPAQKVVDFPT